MHDDPIAKTIFFLVILAWWVFAAVFLLRKQPPRPEETKRDRTSVIGIMLQSLGYAIVWTPPLRRPFFTPLVTMSVATEIAIGLVAVIVAALSVWMVTSAIRTLGKQWAYAARLVEGHQLITTGPYRLVRNPIYTGMFGLLVATGLAASHWWALLLAVLPFAVGTVIRVRSEEKLLRQAFGAEFDAYARRVSAVLPGIY